MSDVYAQSLSDVIDNATPSSAGFNDRRPDISDTCTISHYRNATRGLHGNSEAPAL